MSFIMFLMHFIIGYLQQQHQVTIVNHSQRRQPVSGSQQCIPGIKVGAPLAIDIRALEPYPKSSIRDDRQDLS